MTAITGSGGLQALAAASGATPQSKDSNDIGKKIGDLFKQIFSMAMPAGLLMKAVEMVQQSGGLDALTPQGLTSIVSQLGSAAGLSPLDVGQSLGKSQDLIAGISGSFKNMLSA